MYDYSYVNYLNATEKIKIICHRHGLFLQRPSNHLQGRGCPKCGGTHRYETKEFIEKANIIHKGKFDYALTEYRNCKENVIITCPIHGIFFQKPDNHLRGKGCPKCGGGLRRTTNDFILVAKQMHGTKYDYSQVTYSNNVKKVKIICPEHGPFYQSPSHHLQGKGCWYCSYEARSRHLALGKVNFINRAKILHFNRYNYTLVNYKNAKTPVVIICPKHGQFSQIPSVHLRPAGCIKCANESLISQLTKSPTTFIEEARQIHRDKYDYSEVKYRGAKCKVTIICPQHGKFSQSAESHLAGNGCNKCADKIRSDKKRMKIDEFLSRAKEIHGNKYNYSDVSYQNNRTRVKIKCNVHGTFYQIPHNHLRGMGCPSCAKTGVDLKLPGILYYFRIQTGENKFWKIGITNHSLKKRFMSDYKKVTVIKTWHYDRLEDGYSNEQQILKKYAKYKYVSDSNILSRGGNTELFIKDILELDK